MLDLAYREGKPVERQISATAKFEDLATLQEKLKSSPAYWDYIESSKALQGKETCPALPEPERGEYQ
jgi:hypothetical protein